MNAPFASPQLRRAVSPSAHGGRLAAAAVLAAGAATIAGALATERFGGWQPCELCLLQRWPYYLGVPLAFAVLLSPAGRLRRVGLVLLAFLFMASAGLGSYHAGVEWGWWAGPAGCAGGASGPATFENFLATVDRARLVSCTEAAFRVLGLSLAGWNAVISAALAAVAAWGARTGR